MPTRPLQPCPVQGCAALTKGGKCQRHITRDRSGERGYNRQRGTASQRGYGAAWRELRATVLAEQPYCADPFGAHTTPVRATQVDHIVARRHGGSDKRSNLQGLCSPCHSRKTNARDGGGRTSAARIPARGEGLTARTAGR